MERNEQHDDLIDLGAASVETLGGAGIKNDEQGQLVGAGLSND